jgi:GNAT superfamily N-acetyltransferase
MDVDGGAARQSRTVATYPDRVTDFVIRAALPEEAADISELAIRSKAHWGYDDAFMDASREELTIPPDRIVARRTQVIVSGGGADDGAGGGADGAGGAAGDGVAAGRLPAGRILGFGTIEGEPPAGELGMLFVDPDVIGRGVGGALFSHLAATATALGFHRLTIAADPNAEPFYLSKGAVRIGGVPSGSVPGRTLPLLALAL